MKTMLLYDYYAVFTGQMQIALTVNNKKTKMVCFVFYFSSFIDGVMFSLIFAY